MSTREHPHRHPRQRTTAGPDRRARSRTSRTLRAGDPAELLAQTRLLMRDVPRDCVVLIGHRGRREVRCGARLDLTQVLGPRGHERVGALLRGLRAQGADGAFGVVLLGDGLTGCCTPELFSSLGMLPGEGLDLLGEEPCTDPAECLSRAAGEHAAVRVLSMLALGEVTGLEIPELWVIGGGWATEVLVRPAPPEHLADEPELEVALGPLTALAALDSTLVAAQAVGEGERLPMPSTAGIGAVRALLAAGAGADVSRTLPRPPIMDTWRELVQALDLLRAQGAAPEPDQCMTVCERLCTFVADLAATSRRDEFLEAVVLRGQGAKACSLALPLQVLTDPAFCPDESIRAGGSWFQGMHDAVRMIGPAPGTAWEVTGSILRSGWANLSSCLALVAWWDHRFATAGDLVDAVLEAMPEHSLARLVALVLEGPQMPCWDPRARC